MLPKLMETLFVSVAGGLFFLLIHVPLPWVLGPLTTVMIWHLAMKRNVYWPVCIRNGGLVILGFIMGTSFSPDTWNRILQQLPTMMFTTVTTVIFSIIVAYVTFRLTGVSFPSSIVGSIPGGVLQMVVLSEEITGVNTVVVSIMQTVRFLSVVFTVPILVVHGLAANLIPVSSMGFVRTDIQLTGYSFGYYLFFVCTVAFVTWVAVKIKLPTPFLLGPLLGVLILGFAGIPGPELPSFVRVLSQLCIGAYMGQIMEIAYLKDWKKLLTFSVLGSLALVLFTFVIAYFLTQIHEISLIDAFLSTSPGGMAEMGLTALLVNGDVSLVTTYQLFRVLFIVLIVPPFLRYWLKRLKKQRNYSM